MTQQGAGLCAFAAAFIDEAIGAEAQGIVVTTACDQMRRAAEVITRQVNVPVFLLNVPATCSPAAMALYHEELLRLGRFLVACGGEAPSRKTLLRCIQADESAREREAHPAGAGIPIALVGTPLLREGFDVLAHITAAGGRVVLLGTENGGLMQPDHIDPVRLEIDPLDALAETYFRIPHVGRRPNAGLYAWLAEAITERAVRGIFVHRYLWCDLWTAEVQRMKDAFGLPLLELEVSAEPGAAARLQVRVQAFMEMLA